MAKVGLSALLVLSSCVLVAAGNSGGTKPQQNATRYASVDECIITHKIDEMLCRTGFANARAEFEEKAPRFASRGACEAHFRQCSVFLSNQPPTPADLARRGAPPEYVPLQEASEFVVGKGNAKMVRPVARASKVQIGFLPRTIDKLDIEVSPKRGENSRQDWIKAVARASQPPPQSFAGGNGKDPAISLVDPEAANATDNPATFPVSAKRWNQIKADIKRLNRDKEPRSH